MPESIWNKYEKIKEIENKNSNIKTYLVKIEPLIKEIKPKDKNDYLSIYQRIEKLKSEIKIYDVVDENDKIYIVIENNEEISNKVDKILKEKNIKKEGVVEGHGTPITKNEIFKLFEMEKSMCKIESETKENEKKKGSGFFCKLNNFPIKYALFTNNHILDESNIEIGNKIKFECLEFQKSYFFNSSYNLIKKEIEITDKRRVYTSKELDYTCIELFESDGIKDYFEIDPKIFKYDNNILENNDIFILQYPKGNDISFSNGKIISLKDNIIMHNASTEGGSSGSPIIRRSDNNYIIGLHFGAEEKEDKYLYNLATNFVNILNDIKENMNEINCIYIADKDKNEINLLHDYNEDISNWYENPKKLYIEAKNINKRIYEENMEIYINGKKVKFEYKYKMKELKEINVKFKFKKKDGKYKLYVL